jgi:hypothetical protein
MGDLITGYGDRDTILFLMGLLEMFGLFGLFMISGLIPKDTSSSSCSNSSCYSSTVK